MTTTVTWECKKCKIKLEPQKMLDHLYNVHKLEKGKVITSKKRPIIFADGQNYSIQQYLWVIEGLELIQTIEVEGRSSKTFTDLDVIPS